MILKCLIFLTIHRQIDSAFSSESVVGNGDLYFISAFIRQLEVMEQQCPVLKNKDTVLVFLSQVTDDLCADGLDYSNWFLPL